MITREELQVLAHRLADWRNPDLRGLSYGRANHMEEAARLIEECRDLVRALLAEQHQPKEYR